MIQLLYGLLLGSLSIAPLWAEAVPEPITAPTPLSVPDVLTQTNLASGDLPLPDAIESIVDEDENTRKRAFQRLEITTEADIPVLEKYAQNEDAEVRRQVGLLLQRLKRGTAALVLKFPDGTPAAGQQVSAEMVYVPKPDAKGRPGANKQVFQGELTADAEGKIVLGRYNDGDYAWWIIISRPYLIRREKIHGQMKLEENSAPLSVQVRRGFSGIVTVVDEDGQPIPDAVIKHMGSFSPAQIAGVLPNSFLSRNRGRPFAVTNEKGVAILKNWTIDNPKLAAIKAGYELTGGEIIPAKDGENITVTLKLVKSMPVEYMLTARLEKDKLLPGARVLLVPRSTLESVLGKEWEKTSAAANIPTYIEKGAIDLGTTDLQGKLNIKFIRDQYIMVVFSKNENKVCYTEFFAHPEGGKLDLTFIPVDGTGFKPGQGLFGTH